MPNTFCFQTVCVFVIMTKVCDLTNCL